MQHRTTGTALLSTTPGWMTNRWKPLLPSQKSSRVEWRFVPRPTARICRRNCPPASRRGGGAPYRSGILEPPAISGPLSIGNRLRFSRAGYERGRGATHATGLLELPETGNELTIVVLLALSRRCLIFSARPTTDTPRSRRTEPRRGCGWSPFALFVSGPLPKEAGIIGRLVPRPSTQRHLGPPNAAKHI